MARRSRNNLFTRRLVAYLADIACEYARPHIMAASQQLGRALQSEVVSDTEAFIGVPHYWAVYVHDGRGPFGPNPNRLPPPPAKCLVWFRDPKEDPRLRNGLQPVRYADVKRLTPEQWANGLVANQEAHQKGLPPPMFVMKYHAKATPAKPFFSNEPGGGMAGFFDLASGIIREKVSEAVRDELKDVLDLKGSVTVVI